MPRPRPIPELIADWKAEPYLSDSKTSALVLANCLATLWDLSNADSLLLLAAHKPALELAAIQGHSILRTAYTVGWLDIESDRSIILASLGSREGDDVG